MWSDTIKEHQVIILMLLLALVIGITFIFIVPPWQHYDEPTQFEYSWLIANRPGLPEISDYDQALRRDIAGSMIEHGFFRDMGFTPNLLSTTEQIWIGISQIGSKPLYYWFAAIPLRIIQAADITFQLYTARFLSLVFFLVTIVAAYGLAGELTSPKHPLRWLLPLTILLLPSFVDILTAVNDDVAATAIFSLFLWSGVRMMIRGFNGWRLFALLALSALCFFTKTTVMLAVVLAPVPLLFSLIRPGFKRYAWMALTVAVIVGILLVFDFGFPRNWYQETGAASTRPTADLETSLGNRVFAFENSQDSSNYRISQLIPDDGRNRTGKTSYTIGAWIWADQPATVQSPVLHLTNRSASRQVEVGQEPQFFSFTENIGANNRPYKISLSPGAVTGEQDISIYYEGIILVEGNYEGEIPEMDADSGGSVRLRGSEVNNIVRNSSLELSSLTVRGLIADPLANVFPGNPQLILGMVQDPAPLISYYQISLKVLFHTFWARFGWGQVTLLGYRPYTVLGLFSLLAIAGSLVALFRNRKHIRWDLFLFLGLTLVIIWGSALLRGVTSVIGGSYFFPVARYAYPAIIPTMLILNIGWLEITRWIEQFGKVKQKYQLWVLVAVFILLDILSVYSIYKFYTA
jgi:hypothetical protein